MLMLDAAGIASAAGVQSEETEAPNSIQAVEDTQGDELVSTLLFKDLAGRRRGVRLSLVERLEDVSGHQVSFSAGLLRVAIEGRLLPLLGAEDAFAPSDSSLKLLRLSDGSSEIAFAIDDVIDIVQLAPELHPAVSVGPVGGVVLVEGEAVELLDPFWLFAQAEVAAAPVVESRPLCLLAEPEDRWSREILRPLLEAAGYRVGYADETDESPAAVVLTFGEAPAGNPSPVIRLRNELGAAKEGSVYRYDRVGLLAEIERQVRRRA